MSHLYKCVDRNYEPDYKGNARKLPTVSSNETNAKEALNRVLLIFPRQRTSSARPLYESTVRDRPREPLNKIECFHKHSIFLYYDFINCSRRLLAFS